MVCRFLRKDYDPLLARIEELAHALRQAGEEKGLWAQQSAETWHDNFGYEQEEREQWTISQWLESFVAMKNDAEIVDERVPDEVDIGARVTSRDTGSGEQRRFVVAATRCSTAATRTRSPMPRRSRSRSWAPRWARSAK